MADFNALPALAGKPADLSGLNVDMGNIFSTVEKIKAMRNQNSLFPMEREALEGKLQNNAIVNQLKQVELEQMKQGAAYAKVARGVSALNPDDPVGSSKKWDELMDSLGKEGKQWYGQYSADRVKQFNDIYSQQASQSGQKAKAAAGIGNAFAAALNESDQQQIAQGGNPAVQKLITDFDRVDDEVKQLRKAGKSIKEKWAELADKDPIFKQHYGSEYNAQKFDSLTKTWNGLRPQIEEYRAKSQLGLKPAKEAPKPFNLGGGALALFDQFNTENPVKMFQAPKSEHERAQEQIERDRNANYSARTISQYGNGASGANNAIPQEVAEGNPASKSILAQTGLSLPGFLALTGQASALPRDKNTRDRAFAQAEDFANKRGVDVSTVASQYKANNEVLMKNTERANNARIMEDELVGTLDNLKPVLEKTQAGNLRVANVAKLWAGQQVNDPVMQENAFYVHQLREELAAYMGALQGRSGSGLTREDYLQAEKTIKDGLSSKGADGLKKAILGSTDKMRGVLNRNIDVARKNIWDLFGVGNNFQPNQMINNNSNSGELSSEEQIELEQLRSKFGKK